MKHFSFFGMPRSCPKVWATIVVRSLSHVMPSSSLPQVQTTSALNCPISSVGHYNSLVSTLNFHPCQFSDSKLVWATLIIFVGNWCGRLFYFMPHLSLNTSGLEVSRETQGVLGPRYFHSDWTISVAHMNHFLIHFSPKLIGQFCFRQSTGMELTKAKR